MCFAESHKELLESMKVTGDVSKETYLAIAPRLGNCNRGGILVDIKADE